MMHYPSLISQLTAIINSYFATPYSLPKLDMIAIPDFAAGAMENYGLVTYRETALLYDDQHSAAANKQRVVCLSIKLFLSWNLTFPISISKLVNYY